METKGNINMEKKIYIAPSVKVKELSENAALLSGSDGIIVDPSLEGDQSQSDAKLGGIWWWIED